MKNRPILSIIIPCYNEEFVLPETTKQLNQLMDNLIQIDKIAPESFIYFVEDGSQDRTWDIIQSFHLENSRNKGLKLSRNFGHQNALLAGLESIQGKVDCAISMDADLQDDIYVVERMIDLFYKGYEVVYGVRKRRKTDTFFKKYTAMAFYKLLSLFGVDIVYNHADYRLLSKKAIHELLAFKEVNLFLRAMVPLIGFKSTTIAYDRKKRFAGESKYPIPKMIAFALDGITSFSTTPLRFITIIGFFIFIITGFMSIWAFSLALLKRSIPGWASTVLPIYFLSGIQLFATGILGEYLGKIYQEVKSRPRYIKELELF